MPVRPLNSSVIKWPDGELVRQALQKWAVEIKRNNADVVKVGYFGSYARGDWGVGSDLDIIVVVDKSHQPRERRGIRFDKEQLPVPADLLVYTLYEWESLSASASKFAEVISCEAVWL